jgi:hypothetical protein
MRRWRRGAARLALVSCLVTGAAACTLFVDTKGLSDGASPGSDGGGSPDGPSSTPAPGTDGGDAAAGGVDGAPGRFCDAHKDAIHCEDFDGPALTQDRIETRLGSVAVIAAADARSAPNVLVATVPAISASESGDACYATPPIPTTSKFHVSFDVLVVTGISVVVVDVYGIEPANNFTQGSILGDQNFALFQEFSQLQDGGGANGNNANLGASLTPTWHHLDVCFDFPTLARKASIDGAKSVSPTGISGWPSTAMVLFGAEYATNSPPEEVHIDNVLIDTTACP